MVRLRLQCGASPPENLADANLPAPRYLYDDRTRHHCFRRYHRLLLIRPTPPPARTRQNLNTPINTLSVVANIVHNVGAKPSFAPKPRITFRIIREEWPPSTAYDQAPKAPENSCKHRAWNRRKPSGYGSDKMEELSGEGDAELEENDTLCGEIRFDNGDESSFSTKRW
jgi:hypothetical protein